MADQTITLHVLCLNPPAAPFGLQDKQGGIISGDALPNDRLSFVLTVKVKQKADGTPNFTGVYAQGPASARFLYLTKLDAAGQILRRIKVPLNSITWDQVQTLLADTAAYLLAEVEGTRTGTVPLLGAGWIVKREGAE
jgi:hypothetical protein